MRKALITSVASLAVLGMIGGCLILAGDGFTTSSKRSRWQVFVPAPEAYLMAAIMFTLSSIAVLWLLQQTRMPAWVRLSCVAIYLCVAFAITHVLNQSL